MMFAVKINDRRLLLTAAQVEDLVGLIHGCDYYDEKYVGDNKGSIGHAKNYEPRIHPCIVDEWFDAKVMRTDYIETIKLAMKLEK